MRSRLQIFDRFGAPYGPEIDVDNTRALAINDIGESTFTIPRTLPELKERLIRYKNFVLVTSDYYEPWVGVIEPDRSWSINGPTVKAYTAETMLTMRSPDDVDSAKNLMVASEKITGTAGELLKQILLRANREEDTLLRPGTIFDGGPNREQTLKGNNYWTHLRDIVIRAGYELELQPLVQNNRLQIYVNLYERLGKDKSNEIILEEDKNIEVVDGMPVLNEVGQLSNKLVATGSGSTETSRVAVLRVNQDSIDKYGICHIKTESFSNVTDIGTLGQNAQASVDKEGFAVVTANVAISDIEIIRKVRRGDIVRLKLNTMGFLPTGNIGYNNRTRVLGTGITDSTGKLVCALGEMVGS